MTNRRKVKSLTWKPSNEGVLGFRGLILVQFLLYFCMFCRENKVKENKSKRKEKQNFIFLFSSLKYEEGKFLCFFCYLFIFYFYDLDSLIIQMLMWDFLFFIFISHIIFC